MKLFSRSIFAPFLFLTALFFCQAVNAQVEVDTYKLLKTGTLNITGSVTQSGTGTMAISGTANVIVKSGTLTLSGTSPVSIPSGVVVNSGTMTLTGTSPVSVPGGVVVNSGTLGLSGSQLAVTPQSLTTGTTSFTAGLKRLDFYVVSGTTQWLTPTGTTTYIAGQGYGADLYPNTYPANSLILTDTSQVLVNTIR